MRTLRDFWQRDQLDQSIICDNTWCNVCKQADIGLVQPNEYEEDGRIFVEGKCARCSTLVVTELTEKSC
jgi:hypothetical protein